MYIAISVRSVTWWGACLLTSKQLGAPTGNSSGDRAPRVAPPLSLPAFGCHLFGTYVLFAFTFSGSNSVSFFSSVFRDTGVALRDEVEGMGEVEGAVAAFAALTGSTLLPLLGVFIDSSTGGSVRGFEEEEEEEDEEEGGGLSDVAGAEPEKKLLALFTAT